MGGGSSRPKAKPHAPSRHEASKIVPDQSGGNVITPETVVRRSVSAAPVWVTSSSPNDDMLLQPSVQSEGHLSESPPHSVALAHKSRTPSRAGTPVDPLLQSSVSSRQSLSRRSNRSIDEEASRLSDLHGAEPELNPEDFAEETSTDPPQWLRPETAESEVPMVSPPLSPLRDSRLTQLMQSNFDLSSRYEPPPLLVAECAVVVSRSTFDLTQILPPSRAALQDDVDALLHDVNVDVAVLWCVAQFVRLLFY
jgi:hypothetical protein